MADPLRLQLEIPELVNLEVQLMAVLASAVASFRELPVQITEEEIARCVDWLHAKYGTRHHD